MLGVARQHHYLILALKCVTADRACFLLLYLLFVNFYVNFNVVCSYIVSVFRTVVSNVVQVVGVVVQGKLSRDVLLIGPQTPANSFKPRIYLNSESKMEKGNEDPHGIEVAKQEQHVHEVAHHRDLQVALHHLVHVPYAQRCTVGGNTYVSNVN